MSIRKSTYRRTYYATSPDSMLGATNEQLRRRYVSDELFVPAAVQNGRSWKNSAEDDRGRDTLKPMRNSWILNAFVAAVVACSGPVRAPTERSPAEDASRPCSATTPSSVPSVAAHGASSAPSSTAAVAPAMAANGAEAYPPLELGGTQVRDLRSELTGKQHRLLVALPPSFDKAPSRHYPVLLVLDGQWDFPLVASIGSGLLYDQAAPELLIVGLSWGGENPDYQALRADDYLPTRAKGHDGVEKGGGAPHFLAFLEQAVIPLLEREYRADPQHRIISGVSNGGLFTLYAMLEKPDLFWAYVAISPNVGWDEREIFAREKAFRANHPALERRLWLSSGSAEWPDYLARESDFFKQVVASRYRGLALQVYSVLGERHGGVKPEAYNRALRFVAQPLLAASP